MTAPFQPDGESIAIAWLQTLGLDVDGIGTDLPGSKALWSVRGFVQVPMVVGGTPQIHVPMREPSVEINAWACRLHSELPPWRRAGHIANTIVAAIYDQQRPVDLDLGDGYAPVRMHSIWALTEPRRMPGDPSNYARHVMEAAMRWVVLPDG